jgi:hypothetical protein
MADKKTGKHRIQVKVVDIDTNEERLSGDLVVMRGYCCSCTNWWWGVGPSDPGGPVRSQQ